MKDEPIPPFGDLRITYEKEHLGEPGVPHVLEDGPSHCLAMRIDGKQVEKIYYVDDGQAISDPRRFLYDQYLEKLQAHRNAMMLQTELTPTEADLLALLLKRLTFNQILACTDGNGDTEQAYEMQAAAAKIHEALAELGANPR